MKRLFTWLKGLDRIELVLWCIFALSAISLAAFFISAVSSSVFGRLFNWDHNFLTWILSTLGVMATSLTGFAIYKQFKEQRKYTSYIMYPKIVVRTSKKQFHDQIINNKNYHVEINKKQHLTLRTDIINQSINHGYIQVGVIASIYNNKNNNYIKQLLRSTRGHRMLNMSEEILISPEGNITNDYSFPHHFIKKEKKQTEIFELINTYQENNCDYNDNDDYGYYYLCFLARVKLDKDTSWIYNIHKYYYFNFSNDTYSVIYHLPQEIEDYINQKKEENGWDTT